MNINNPHCQTLLALFDAYQTAVMNEREVTNAHPSKEGHLPDETSAAKKLVTAAAANLRIALSKAGIPTDGDNKRSEKYLRYYGYGVHYTEINNGKLHAKEAERLRHTLVSQYVKAMTRITAEAAEKARVAALPETVYRELVRIEHHYARLDRFERGMEWDQYYKLLTEARAKREHYLLAHPELAAKLPAVEA